MKICPVCQKQIEKNDLFMVGVDKPYFNVFMHKQCFKMIDINSWLAENGEMLYNNYVNSSERGKNAKRK